MIRLNMTRAMRMLEEWADIVNRDELHNEQPPAAWPAFENVWAT